jgi:hypothetical protein
MKLSECLFDVGAYSETDDAMFKKYVMSFFGQYLDPNCFSSRTLPIRRMSGFHMNQFN